LEVLVGFMGVFFCGCFLGLGLDFMSSLLAEVRAKGFGKNLGFTFEVVLIDLFVLIHIRLDRRLKHDERGVTTERVDHNPYTLGGRVSLALPRHSFLREAQ
jgi:hypothetical protein